MKVKFFFYAVILFVLTIRYSFAYAEYPQALGDLIFRDTEGYVYGRDGLNFTKPGHVGIYVGNNMVVEAVFSEIMKNPISETIGQRSFYSDKDGNIVHYPLGTKTHANLQSNPNSLILRDNIVYLAKQQIGEGYDNNWAVQKGPDSNDWSCCGLAEKVYESCAGQTLIYHDDYGDEYLYYGGLNITSDGYEYHFNDLKFYYQENVEFSQIPNTYILGRSFGLVKYMFFPYTQFKQATLIDSFETDPNDSYQQASNLGEIEGLYEKSNLSIVSGDVDYYKFKILDTGTGNDYVRIDIDGSGEGGSNLALAIYKFNNKNNFVPAKLKEWDYLSDTKNDYEIVSLDEYDAGVYYAIVFGTSESEDKLGESNPSFIGTENSGYSLSIHGPQQGVNPPGQPKNPSPEDGATGQPISTTLSWSNGGGATSYDVYFWTNSSPDSGEYKNSTSSTSFNPGTLSYNTTYYWQIDAKNSAGKTDGKVWSFKTISGSKPVVSISATDSSASEPDNDGYFKISRTGSTSSKLEVFYAVSGTATSGSDYLALSGSVTISAGKSSAIISVDIIDDSQTEDSEKVKVTLSDNTSYDIGSSKSATVTIADDDDTQKVSMPMLIYTTQSNGAFRIELLCSPSDATIYYTTDGSIPTSNSTEYTEAFTISDSCTVKACGFKIGYANSDVTSVDFTIDPSTNILPVYRLYNPKRGFFYFTLYGQEKNALIQNGWSDKGVAWYAYPANSHPLDSLPVYRLYNPKRGFFYFTLYGQEKNALIQNGWSDKGVAWYAYSVNNSSSGSLPVYRLYNSKRGFFYFTRYEQEKNALIQNGWSNKGVSWYAHSSSASVSFLSMEAVDYQFFEQAISDVDEKSAGNLVNQLVNMNGENANQVDFPIDYPFLTSALSNKNWENTSNSDQSSIYVAAQNSDFNTNIVGSSPGIFTTDVNCHKNYELELNITNSAGIPYSDIVQEWLVFGILAEGIDTSPFFITTDGEIVSLDTVSDPDSLTFNFDHSVETIKLATSINLSEFGLQGGDVLWYSYVYSTSQITDFSSAPDLVFENYVLIDIVD